MFLDSISRLYLHTIHSFGVEFRHDVLGLVRIVVHPFANGFVDHVTVKVCSQRYRAVSEFRLNYLILIAERTLHHIGIDVDEAFVLVDKRNQHVERCLSFLSFVHFTVLLNTLQR